MIQLLLNQPCTSNQKITAVHRFYVHKQKPVSVHSQPCHFGLLLLGHQVTRFSTVFSVTLALSYAIVHLQEFRVQP